MAACRSMLLAFIAAAALGGCADERTTSSEEVESAIHAFLEACGAGDGEAALDVLTGGAARAFLEEPSVLDGCAEIVGVVPLADQVEDVAHEAGVRKRL